MAATNPLLQNILCPKFSFRIFSLQKNISPKVLFFFPFFKVCVGSPSSKYPPQTTLLSKNFFTSFSTFSRPSFLLLQPPTPLPSLSSNSSHPCVHLIFLHLLLHLQQCALSLHYDGLKVYANNILSLKTPNFSHYIMKVLHNV